MSDLFIGIMSGTSLDAIDAVAVDLGKTDFRMIANHSCKLDESLREKLLRLTRPDHNEIERMAEAERAFVQQEAETVKQLLQNKGLSAQRIVAIGSHGQTIRHYPDKGFSLQLDNPHLLAELTGITVVSDFRRRDLAAGGQGAPLVPAFHQSAFRDSRFNRSIINIGGMANITYLPANPNERVTGWDTGPGNVLIDSWCQRHTGNKYDDGGRWAATSRPSNRLLRELMRDPHITAHPPKSTGRELYNNSWLEKQLMDFKELTDTTVAATLTALTAHSIAANIRLFADKTEQLYLCGGGAKNDYLIQLLGEELQGSTIHTTEALGIAPDWVEATAFAWLAKQTLDGKPGNIPDATGANGERVLGSICPA